LDSVRLHSRQVARLAVEFTAQSLERREADGARLVGLQNRQVRDRDANAVGKLGQGEAAVQQQVIEKQ
jgi:hypothetical protein